MATGLARLIFLAGIAQVGVLIASAVVPFRLNWRDELRGLSRLHRQMYWVYGGYVVLSIVAFAMISILNRPHELRAHLRGALRNGVTKQEIAEVFLQVGCYAGAPAAVDSFRIAREFFKEIDGKKI